MTAKLRVDLTGPPQTMLATLYAKAVDAASPNPILGDRYAAAAVAKIDYDWRRTSITPRSAPSVALRSKHFDDWTRQFLSAHPRANVVHLGCGLDPRVYRIDPGPGVGWFDVDYPEVIALRRRVFDDRPGYRMIGAAVTDPAWVATVPADAPTLVLGEGLTMYLTRDEGLELLRRLVAHLPSGEVQFDAFNATGIRLQKLNTVVRRSGSTLHWAINGPEDIVAHVAGLRLLVAESVFDSEDFRSLGASYRFLDRLLSLTPTLHNIAQYHRYAFG